MTLNSRPTPDDLCAFAFAIGVGGALAALGIGLVSGLGGAGSVAAGWVVLVLTAGAGLGRPSAFTWTYRKWNGLAQRVAAMGRRYTTAVIFYLMFVVVARGGARFRRRRGAEGSGWGLKSIPELRSQIGYVPVGGIPEPWGERLAMWSRGKVSRWSVLLLPLLRLLDALEGQTGVRTADDIYTLY